MNELTVLRDLFSARFDALDAKLVSIVKSLEKDIDRQDETIERLADRTPHISEIRRQTDEIHRLTERIVKLEAQIERGRDQLSDLNYKVKVTWGIWSTLFTLLLTLIIAFAKNWIGI